MAIKDLFMKKFAGEVDHYTKFVLKPGEKYSVMPFGSGLYMVVVIFSGSGELLNKNGTRAAVLGSDQIFDGRSFVEGDLYEIHNDEKEDLVFMSLVMKKL